MRLFEPTPTGRVPSPRPGRDGSFPYPDTPNPGRRADQARAENVAADTRAASRPRPVAPSASGISSSTLRESQAIAPPENAAETPAEAPLVSAANTAPRPPGKTSENFPTAGRDYELVGRWSPHMRAADGLRLVPRPRIDGRFRGRVEGGAEMFQAERGHGLGDHRRAVLFISNGGLVSQFLDYTNQQGVVHNIPELVELLIDSGIRFVLGVRVRQPLPLVENALHAVQARALFDPRSSLAEQCDRWMREVQRHCQLPHVIRAALARGGIISLIVRALVDSPFPLAATEAVQEYGSSSSVLANDLVYHHDWLAAAEERIIVGFADAESRHSLMPPAQLWDEFVPGMTNIATEEWFHRRMHAMRYAQFGDTAEDGSKAMSESDWRLLLAAESPAWFADPLI
ncbi:hypothetical protein AURDEDRAFT_131884 [Auricularia subglabra TFB-10046 SS5]|uniref:Uncharacterized protein n=1 Tax=Auricularia subglabra (strain TFB-10046 / SS5) TaxID=717982 RepID=J0WL61_AURST|nr:hypothetical protein AURDEDRAFT_131884 [Auricularia subglabra TFB-10046 SS5]